MKLWIFSISLVLYIMLVAGIVLAFSRSFSNMLARMSLRFRLLGRGKDSVESAMFSFLSRLVFSAFGYEKKGKLLFTILVFIFTFSFVFSNIHFKLLISLFIAFLCTSVPVLLILSRIEAIRNRSSKECITFINEFYREYRIENKNIYTAMEKTSNESGNYPVCGSCMYKLLLRLRSSGTASEQKLYCDDFAYALGSGWGKSLSKCILAACSGTDVSQALLDILSQLKFSKESLEERKRLNSESMRMTVFLVPALYIGSFFAGSKWLGISTKTLLHNQFSSSAGVLFFFAILILFFFNYIVLNLVSAERIDI